MSRFALVAPRLFDGAGFREDAAVVVEKGRIAAIVEAAALDPGGVQRLPAGSLLAPGFVDLQVNGGGGVLLNDAPHAEGVATILAAHRRHGTTGLVPTLISDTRAVLARLVDAAEEIAALPGVVGFHVEGPFLAPARKGIHREDLLRLPEEEDFRLLARLARIAPTILTLAPERMPRGTIARFTEAGVRVFLGHTEATEADVRAAIEEGAVGVTHLFNAMSQLTPREPGLVGTALADGRFVCGIIADGLHVAPTGLALARRALGRERLALVTDAMPSLGSPEGGFTLHGRTITLEDGRLTGPDGTLAGAHLGMNEAVRNACRMMGASLADALFMAARTPARALGLPLEHGRIVPRAPADLVALDANLDVIATWIGGVRG